MQLLLIFGIYRIIMFCIVTVIFITQALMFTSVYALENLALKKPTWQEHPWPDPRRDFGSENAVDGLYYDRRARSGQCTINDDGYYTAEWRVDLGSASSISHINIYYRTDNENPGPFVNRMAGFSLYVSNTTSKDQGHLCYKDQSEGTPSVNQNISCSIYGRYVIYYNERSRYNTSRNMSQYAHNELCEVEVYGCQGQYGDNCLYSCPRNCLNGKCDKYTGQCLSCFPGYYGQQCSNECKNNHFGVDCKKKCGHCLADDRCNHINGSCLNGCSHGYRGIHCNETCPSGRFGIECLNRCDTYCSGNESCDPVIGVCIEGCKQGYSGLMCGLDKFSDRQPCGDNMPIVIGVVLSVVIVLLGSVINFIYWRRKKDFSRETSKQYTELGDNNKSSNYEEINIY